MSSPTTKFLFIATIVLWCLVKLAYSLSSSTVTVWDNVLSVDNQKCLKKVCSQQGSGQHYAFSRPLDENNSSNNNYSVLEKSLDSILTELGDDSKYVEYWTRQEWRSIEAHADVDEFLAKKQDANGSGNDSTFRYPTYGHVLYLQVGTEVRGPTCVFPNKRSGGDLLRRHNERNENESNSADGVEVVTVPAVPGRLLRFQGDYLHAVPRPADLWFLKFIQGAAKYDPEEEWGRSVVLFNVWDEPPSDVPMNSAGGSDHGKDDTECECEPYSKWTETYSTLQNNKEDSCQVTDDSDEEMLPAKIWLLGNERRRDHPMRTLKLLAPVSLRAGLSEESRVSQFLLQQP